MTEVALWARQHRRRNRLSGGAGWARESEEYFSEHVLEQSLSVDNLFVPVLVFDYFKVPS